MVITNQKPIINTQKKTKRKECKPNTKESHQTTGRRAREKERNREGLLKHQEKKLKKW